MRTISLVILPGGGQRSVEIAENSTIAQLSSQFNLTGKNVFVNGVAVAPGDWSSTTIEDIERRQNYTGTTEVVATSTVKGN